MEKLEKIHVRNFGTITEYYRNCLELFKTADLCVSKENVLTDREKVRLFNRGLASWMRLEAARIEGKTMEETVKMIEKLERAKTEHETRTFKPKQFPSSRYCTYHRSTSHDTRDCRTTRHREDTGKHGEGITKQDGDEKANIIFEKRTSMTKATVKTQIEEREVEALCDTGATCSIVRRELCDELGLKKIQLDVPRRVELADGKRVELQHECEIQFTIKDIPDARYKTKATILEGCGYELILGTDFMEQAETVINFKDATITIDGYTLDRRKVDEQDSHYPDEVLIEQAYECTETQKETNEISKLIRESRCKNPKLGRVKGTEHIIRVIEHTPIESKAYRIPWKYEQRMREEINLLIEQGIIRESNSDYSSPAFVVEKKTGKLRLLIDYRRLNAITHPEEYPFPGIEDLLLGLGGAQYFTTIDLNQGYYQIAMHPKAVRYTAFDMPFGRYEFLRMPFGLKNAPKSFQRAICTTLRGIEHIRIYLDDILIASKTLKEHTEHVGEVIKRLFDAGFSINFEKSHFAKEQVIFLGREISKYGIRPVVDSKLDPEKLTWPKTKKQLQGLIGMINWFRAFIPKLSTKMIAATNKLKGELRNIEWSDIEKTEIKQVMTEVNQKTTIKHADINKPFTLHTDASDVGISAILRQDHGIIGIYSAKLGPSEANYSTMEKELLAIIKGLRRFRNIVLGQSIEIHTDNKNLTFENQTESQRVHRWKNALNEFDIRYKHVPGPDNGAADYLSRHHVMVTRNHESVNLDDESIQTYLTTSCNTINGKFHVPEDKARDIITYYHNKLLHPGETKLYTTLRRILDIKCLKELCRNEAKMCQACQTEKRYKTRYKTSGHLHSQEKGLDICVDILGPISLCDFKEGVGVRHVLAIVDRHSRYLVITDLRELTSKAVISAIENTWIKRNGKPRSILSDQGRQFIAQEFHDWANKANIKVQTTTPYNPTGNSIVERANQEISKGLRLLRGTKFKQALTKIEFAINNSVNRSIGCTPHEAMTNQRSLDPLHRNYPEMNEADINKRIRDRANKETDNNGKKLCNLKEGDMVWVATETTGKLKPRWRGPAKIHKMSSTKNVVTVDLGYKLWRISVKKIRPY
ncbi:hypothetical protein PAPHI01_2652 [Pancytospora philotis]|nr:hypothetical protein PAPHI01_2652 [Pancytospora philotis]